MSEPARSDAPATDAVPVGKMVLFEGAGAPTLDESGMVVERSFVDGESVVDLMPEEVLDGSLPLKADATVPFRHDDPEGISLCDLEFGPGYVFPRHSHSADCLYYIVRGTIEMGSRTLGPGDGFFVPAEHPYTYRTGPEGTKLLEFRTRTEFDSKFLEPDLAAYKSRLVDSLSDHTP